ncbi:MAG: bifunctional sulfate adenylyltransferase/adenylylsulfate kinase [Candidatus Marinimicrobia bacterium]|nr:bifunctional sulfate adenylyltransferase/adenylylsulfate kinase [Candidatus Neomarinimicrobiota bacterium]MCF7839831.1 bifunctional sulfate adenylyltransferase/adenylylsulfate kinase [Candidatus Neomarinimicrobiota bacterium]MCF7902718.1 bifunctional sulfate adenylyltransferase/adenylylsulfate kinase [Candidatus Neomarinimicrobiota bacterium]
MLQLIDPHGGELKNLMVASSRMADLKAATLHMPSWTMEDHQIDDLELLLNGGFSPLTGYLTQEEYKSVLSEMRLPDGSLWSVPITLGVSKKFAETVATGTQIVLRDTEGLALAVLTVTDKWAPDKSEEAEAVFGTTDRAHPGVKQLFDQIGEVYLGGPVEGLTLPHHYDFKEYRDTPEELRRIFQKLGWYNVTAFQTRNPMHRAHFEMTLRATSKYKTNLLINPAVGVTKPGDVDHYTRVRCYQKLLPKYPTGTAMLSLVPLAMRMAGPREALWHAIIRKNFGCNHFIIGRDHASPGNNSNGEHFYPPYAAQELLEQHADELGITVIKFKKLVYNEDKAEYQPIDEVKEGERTLDISGTELRHRLEKGLDIPEWFSFPEVIEELRHTYPPMIHRGFTLFFTGLSGSGKSTLANGLYVKLMEDGRRPATLLDGDVVRTHLSKELGFSKEHRSINVRRIGYVASEITKNGGIAICAPIAPYEEDRRLNRELISHYGGYIEIFVNTPLEECEKRDVKGLYAKARKGLIKEFTGISDPYEEPENPEMVVDTTGVEPEALVQEILLKIKQLGYV